MEARLTRIVLCATLLVALPCGLAAAGSYRTANFVVTAPSEEFARKVAETAEQYREELAVHWIGEKMPNWANPCPIKVEVGPTMGAGGATSFVFQHGEVFDWKMSIQGSEERILDSVLPHEVTHTIFASYFRQPLPRWADEGACTTVEHASERKKQQKLLIEFLQTGRGIAFSRMFAMKEYPADVLPLYSQGHSLVSFLLAQGGRQKFMQYVRQGLDSPNWSQVTKQQYGFQDLSQLQQTWLEWVKLGSPQEVPLALIPASHRGGVQLASNTNPAGDDSSATADAPGQRLIYRGQNEDHAPGQQMQQAAGLEKSIYAPANRQQRIQRGEPAREELPTAAQPTAATQVAAGEAPLDHQAVSLVGPLVPVPPAPSVPLAREQLQPGQAVAQAAVPRGEILLEWERPGMQPAADPYLPSALRSQASSGTQRR